MRFLVPILFILLFDWYTFEAFELVSQEWSLAGRIALRAVFWSVTFIAIFYLLGGVPRRHPLQNKRTVTLIRYLIFLAYFSKFLIVAALLTNDIWRLGLAAYEGLAGYQGYNLERTVFSAWSAIALGAFPFFLLTYGIIRNPYRYKVFRESVAIKNLPDALVGLKIVQISDIHSGSFTKKEPIKKAIQLINAEAADLVFFTGDLVNSSASEMAPFIDIFDKIESRYGVYSILGNHDYGDYRAWESEAAKQQNFQKMIDTHQQLGWDLMMNENRMLQINGESIAVIGVENYSASKRFHKYGDLRQAYSGAEAAGLKLLLSHDPTHWDDEVISDYTDIAITFSGHTHGFQFGLEIPGWFRWSPVKYVYRKWAGLYQEGQQYLYVNRGLGFLGYPGRVGILPEITVIELSKE